MARTKIDISLPDLTGKRVVITGASDGMGLVMATRLAAAGAELILPVRNAAKGDRAIGRIRHDHPRAKISLRALDLSSLASIAAFGDTLRREGNPVHVLINNAGVMRPPNRQTTADGFEVQFGTNTWPFRPRRAPAAAAERRPRPSHLPAQRVRPLGQGQLGRPQLGTFLQRHARLQPV